MRSNSGVIDFWSQSDTTNKSNKSGTADGKKKLEGHYSYSIEVVYIEDPWRKEVFFLVGQKNGGGKEKPPWHPRFRRPCKYKKEIPKVSYFKSYTLQKIQ